MGIVSSTYTQDAHEQVGGGRWVVERHTDSTVAVHQVGPYLALEGFDIAAAVTARAAQISESLADSEAQQWLES